MNAIGKLDVWRKMILLTTIGGTRDVENVRKVGYLAIYNDAIAHFKMEL
jgi:hypothetical protein